MVPLLTAHGKKIGSVGCSVGDTVLSLKLQVQVLYGIPMSRLRVREEYTGEVIGNIQGSNGQYSCYVY